MVKRRPGDREEEEEKEQEDCTHPVFSLKGLFIWRDDHSVNVSISVQQMHHQRTVPCSRTLDTQKVWAKDQTSE